MYIFRYLFFLFCFLPNWILLKINKVRLEGAISISGIIVLYNHGNMRIGREVRINTNRYKNIIGGDTRTSIVVKRGAELVIGANVGISNSAIYCAEKITIGNNVMIGGSCKIWDTDFHPLNPIDRIDNPNLGYKTKPIFIGDGVFIGGFSIILKGSTIGNNSIIGAGSVVSGTVPANEVWGGNPARFIKKVID